MVFSGRRHPGLLVEPTVEHGRDGLAGQVERQMEARDERNNRDERERTGERNGFRGERVAVGAGMQRPSAPPALRWGMGTGQGSGGSARSDLFSFLFCLCLDEGNLGILKKLTNLSNVKSLETNGSGIVA